MLLKRNDQLVKAFVFIVAFISDESRDGSSQ